MSNSKKKKKKKKKERKKQTTKHDFSRQKYIIAVAIEIEIQLIVFTRGCNNNRTIEYK